MHRGAEKQDTFSEGLQCRGVEEGKGEGLRSGRKLNNSLKFPGEEQRNWKQKGPQEMNKSGLGGEKQGRRPGCCPNSGLLPHAGTKLGFSPARHPTATRGMLGAFPSSAYNQLSPFYRHRAEAQKDYDLLSLTITLLPYGVLLKRLLRLRRAIILLLLGLTCNQSSLLSPLHQHSVGSAQQQQLSHKYGNGAHKS